ncbi:hypothetical protein [Sulfurimonas sp.]
MKKKLKVIVTSLAFVATSAMAGESLIGVEGSFGSMNVDTQDTVTNVTVNNDVGLIGGGVKIGAQGDEYRIFLNANYYYPSETNYDYVTTYGAEIDYLVNVSDVFNIFLGANGGIANIKLTDAANVSRTSSDNYIGGSGGINLHLGDSVDFELGGRLLLLDINNLKNNVKYTFNTIVTGYASIIYKYQMD